MFDVEETVQRWSILPIILYWRVTEGSTYQLFVHLDGLFKDGPNHCFMAQRGGQGAIVAVVCSSVYIAKQVINGNLLCDINFWPCRGAKKQTNTVVKLLNDHMKRRNLQQNKGLLTDVLNSYKVAGQFFPGFLIRCMVCWGICLRRESWWVTEWCVTVAVQSATQAAAVTSWWSDPSLLLFESATCKRQREKPFSTTETGWKTM